MSDRPRVLYVTHRVPFPPDKGDRIRNYHVLRQLAKRARVWLLALADEPVPDSTRAELARLCERVEYQPVGGWRQKGRMVFAVTGNIGRRTADGGFRSASLSAAAHFSGRAFRVIRGWAAEASFSGYVASSGAIAEYIHALRPLNTRVVDLVDVDSQKWLDFAAANRGPKRWLYQFEARRTRAEERGLAEWADAVTIVSRHEADVFDSFTRPGAATVATNGVDLDYWHPSDTPEQPALAFVGALDYLPNVDAAVWFAEHVWPRVRERVPAAEFRVIGRKPAPRVQALGKLPGVTVVGQVPDVRPHVASAAVCVVPMRLSRGLAEQGAGGPGDGQGDRRRPAGAGGVANRAGRSPAAGRDARRVGGRGVRAARRPGPAAGVGRRRPAVRGGEPPLGHLPEAAGGRGAAAGRGAIVTPGDGHSVGAATARERLAGELPSLGGATARRSLAVAAPAERPTERPPAKRPPVVFDTRVVTGSGGGPDKTILNSPRFLDPHYRMLCGYLHPPNDPGFADLRAKAARYHAPLVSIPDRGPWDWRVVSGLLSVCRREKVRIYHGHDYKTNALGLLLARFWPDAAGDHPARLGPPHRPHAAVLPIDRWTLPRYERVISVSQDLHDAALGAGVPADRAVLLENGIDVEDYRRRRTAPEAKAALGLPPDLLVGACGRLEKEKAFDVLIRSVAKLPGVRLRILGEGGDRPRLEALVRELGVADRVALPGWVSDVRGTFEAFDVFALPSLREGLPNVLLEAMALEVPCVATRIAGIPKLIQDGENGRLVEPGDQAGFDAALGGLTAERTMRERFAAAGRRTIETRYSFAVRMGKLRALYDELTSFLARRRPGGRPRSRLAHAPHEPPRADRHPAPPVVRPAGRAGGRGPHPHRPGPGRPAAGADGVRHERRPAPARPAPRLADRAAGRPRPPHPRRRGHRGRPHRRLPAARVRQEPAVRPVPGQPAVPEQQRGDRRRPGPSAAG